jgi:glycosyltransferase involved in cell wall biosynthesis
VIICARNRAHVIGRCLDSVIAAHPAEIIVVDDHSTDRTADIARAKGAKVVKNGNQAGLGAARQLGASLAQYDYIVFVDDDIVVEPTTMQDLLDEATAHQYDGLMARLPTWYAKPTYWQKAEGWRRQFQMRPGVATVIGCGITLFRRELVMRIGFDPVFEGAAEDADFSFHATSAGAVLAYATKALAYHEDRAHLRSVANQKIWHGRGLARLFTRYGGRYARRAATQVNSSLGETKLNGYFIPYLVVSWTCTSLGLGLELLRIALDPELRQQLNATQAPPSRHARPL